MHSCHPQSIVTFASQEFALNENIRQNEFEPVQSRYLMDRWEETEIAILRIPKSVDLFRLYLSRIANVLQENGTVFCGFMTRNFTPVWIKMAEEYFSEVTQTKARKKARLLVLRGPKKNNESLIQEFADEKGGLWKQYLGVFSSGHIDYASQFLMDHLDISPGYITALDVGSGNGVLGKFILTVNPDAEVHLTDDFLLAVKSGEMNLTGDHVHHHFFRNLDYMPDDSCDLVVTNPPFHLEYEINLDVAHQIFRDAHRVLKKDGKFWVVANNNLPYKPELTKYFKKVKVIAQNRRFIVYCCEI